jgi:class 3 adenylate cyclase
LVEIARPQSIIVSAEVAHALADDAAFTFPRLRSRRIRGIGRVEIYVAGPGDAGEPDHRASEVGPEGKFTGA